MKDYLRQLVAGGQTTLVKRSTVREYLQARLLQSLQESRAFLDWAFLGGTALRFLYGAPRYSEDLDFSLISSDRPSRFGPVLEAARRMFAAEDYTPAVKSNDQKPVHSALFRFQGLFHELGLSPHPSETVAVKLEVDTNPPDGAAIETTITRRYVTLNLTHHDRASLLAGKLHAIFARPYTKGRDLYDLVWFLADRTWPEPNLVLLNAALAQTGWARAALTSETWRSVLAERLANVDWRHAAEDVRPFLERENDAALLTQENCLSLVRPA